MKQFVSPLLAILLILSGASIAMAATDSAHCNRHNDHFKASDTNGDGFIDKDEANAAHQKHFDEIDTNHDGKLSADEIKACCKRKSGKTTGLTAFDHADGDHDGTLDREEAKQMPRVSKNFDAIDTDKDGTIDHDELHQFMMQKRKSN